MPTSSRNVATGNHRKPAGSAPARSGRCAGRSRGSATSTAAQHSAATTATAPITVRHPKRSAAHGARNAEITARAGTPAVLTVSAVARRDAGTAAPIATFVPALPSE